MFNSSLPAGGSISSAYVGPKSYAEFPGVEKIILSVILSIFCVVGTIGNALAFIIYYRKREKGTSTIFILSLAVTDFLTCLINLPYSIAAILLNYRLEYDIVCRLFLYIQTSNVPLSSLIMVAIGIDRYLCICHPFLHIVTVRRAKISVVVLTIIAGLTGIIPALSHSVFRKTQNETVSSNSSNETFEYFSSNGSEATSPVFMSQLLTNGLLLEPAAEFVSDILKHGAPVNPQTDNIDVLSTTPSLPTSSIYPSTTTPVIDSTTTENASDIFPDEYYIGMCVENEDTISENISKTFQITYAVSFLFELLILALLYALIYRSILARRAWKIKRKRMSCYASTNCPETIAEETQLTNINGGNGETIVLKKNPGRFSSAMRDRTLHANIKTAAMLFVVTIGFVVSFVPSWLMGLRIVPIQLSVFYMFYINNVINPFIYAFMNRTFREDLFQLVKSMFRH
ncbi:unnamed protein product [Candidula unifasciata]|uniref:G-protein coupled receptors family 1 profile domain-containing protein n=1 Tax=Candidula unifasciata TaxID=100452 RepID=A0A8S3Z9S5_9EUPU|nr:unnamed protein product [Candidula unifasciata]